MCKWLCRNLMYFVYKVCNKVVLRNVKIRDTEAGA